tara:strand:- start:269 stop:649 length:381 start_codon:yes stop_codon:yes gene_type:complete
MQRRIVLFTLIALILQSCATITRGRTQAFTVTSEPTQANVMFSNGLVCLTPCTLMLPRRPGFVVSVSKEGYKMITANVVSQIAGAGGAALAGNVVLGGLIGAGVDSTTGATNELVPNPLHLVLEEE